MSDGRSKFRRRGLTVDIALSIVGGLIVLVLGAEFLVRGAVRLAEGFGVSPLLIGLTVVGFGTSTPELLVSVQAAMAGAPAIAIGNVIGSNIANILLILGLTALILPVPVSFPDTRRDFAVAIGATLVLWAMLLGGTIWRWQGLMLIAGLALYLFQCFRSGSTAGEADLPAAGASMAKSLLLALGGLVVLMIGARLLVESASDIARTFGVSEAVIGLSIVAIGTSLPELATSALAAMRGHSEIAVGSILGSCIFNLLGILGVTAILAPIPVDPRFAQLDIAAALAAALAMLYLAAIRGGVGRIGGVLLLLSYAGYMVTLA